MAVDQQRVPLRTPHALKTRVTVAVLICVAAASSGAAPVAPPLPDAPERPEQGLALTVETPDGKMSDTRQVRMLALYVPQGAAPTPFLAPGKFRATWSGDLNLRLRERLAFVAEGRGKISVRIKDKVVFEAEGEDLSTKAGAVVRIDKGKNPLMVTYEPPDKGDAWVRVRWKEQQGLIADPVPPTTFTHNASAKAVAEGARLREGRQLLADLRCAKCHDAGPLPGGAMPELAMDSPSLAVAGARLNPGWVAAWVENPRAFRKDAHMPRVLADPKQAADIAAYLATLDSAAPVSNAPGADLVTRGGQLFSSLMCAACHTAPDAETVADNDTRVPLAYVKAKYRPDALRQYLLKPEAHYAWNPMPNSKLGDDEAAALAAYLLDKATQTVPAAPQGDAAKGKEVVQSSGCLNCHTIEGEKTTLAAPALAAIDGGRWTHGCMAADPAARKAAPDFGLAERERHALLAFAATDRSSLARETAEEFSLRQVAAMRCTSCHARDGKESLFATDHAAEAAKLAAAFPLPQASAGVHEGEHFAPDQRPPILTWAGEKLRPEWSAAFIGGQIPYKPRPYLHARMPAWPARAALMAQGIAAEHGYSPATEPYPKPDESMAAAGQKLIGAAGGFSCVQCHAVGAAPPLAPFEAPALNMQYITERLRKDYYHRWMLNPIKVDPGTKMPAFADSEGKSAIRDVYDGDGTQQFEAIWQFLLRGNDVKPPQ